MASTHWRRIAGVIAGLCLAFVLPAPPAHAASAVDAAAIAFGIKGYTQTTMAGTGDITARFSTAVKQAGSARSPHVVYLPAGAYTLSSGVEIRVADHVYIVAEAGAAIAWKGASNAALDFKGLSAAGVYGGTWNGKGGKTDTTSVLRVLTSTVVFDHVTVTAAPNYGIVAHTGARVTVRNTTVTGSRKDGVYAVDSALTVSNLVSTKNYRSGLQLSNDSTATVTASKLDGNGLAVTGSTTGKTGHGLGISTGSHATVTDTTMNNNKVCGLSLSSAGASATVSSSSMNGNGRHGVGSTTGVSLSLNSSTVAGNKFNGVLTSGKGTKMTLTQVTVSGTAGDGVAAINGGTASLVRTTVTTSKHSNLSVSPGSSLVLKDGNTSTSAHSYGIVVTQGKLVIAGTGNVVSRNRLYGVLIQKKSKLSISGAVKVSSNRKDGMRIKSGSKLSITGDGTVFTSNKGAGLLLMDKGTTGKATRPLTITKNLGYGIRVKTKARLTIVESTFSGNKPKQWKVQSKGTLTISA